MGNTVNRRIYGDSNHVEFVGSVINGELNINYGGSETSKRSEILEWISAIPYKSHHMRISENRLEGTGEWILEKEEYRNWESSSVSMLLLLRGTPGAGKTYIASRVIDLFLSDPTPGGFAYFYCNRAEENRRNPEEILNALVQQLAQTSEKNKLLKPVVDIYERRQKEGQKASRLSLAESQELLVQLTDIYPRTTICIDALDEVNPTMRFKLLNALKDVVKRSASVVKFFTTARMDTDILINLESFPRVELQPDDNISDINRFVENSIQNTIDDGRLLHGDVPSELKLEICNVLRHRSKGMFQLAALQIAFICEMCTARDVRRSLKVLPDTLTEIYGEIYKHIVAQKGSAPRLALNAFRWMQCSYEPIRTQTLLDAITAEVGDSGEFSHEDTIKVNDLLRACHNLIILDERLDVFRFAHLSVDEYLETQLPRVGSHATIARVCLSLVCTPSAWVDYDVSLQTSEGDYRKRHLLLYSVVFWPWHLARFEDASTCPILTCIWDTFVSGTNHRRWLDYHMSRISTSEYSQEIFWRRSHTLQKESDDVLFTVCVFGLRRRFTPVFESQSVGKSRLDQLLLLSCCFGELDVAQLLIDRGSDVSASDKYGLKPLHIAVEGGHKAVARLLIDWGADVSGVGRYGQTPLGIALEKWCEAVAQLLIDRGADVSAADKNGQTPLHNALKRRHEAAAQLLIDRGAAVSAIGKFGQTPLHIALEQGLEAVARLLIDRGANVSASDDAGRTPLHIVSRIRHEAMAQLLIDRGADVSAADRFGQMPLHIASWSGDDAVARLLIDRGADISATDINGWTPLDLASIMRKQTVVQLLRQCLASRN